MTQRPPPARVRRSAPANKSPTANSPGGDPPGRQQIESPPANSAPGIGHTAVATDCRSPNAGTAKAAGGFQGTIHHIRIRDPPTDAFTPNGHANNLRIVRSRRSAGVATVKQKIIATDENQMHTDKRF